MGDANPIRTPGDHSKPSHEGYRNTIELPAGNNMVPLRSDTIQLVQNGCSFHRLRTAKLRNDILMFQQHQGESLSEEIIENLALYDHEGWNDSKDFTKPVKAISLPQDVLSTSDRCLIELENQVQCLMEAHLAPMQPTQVNKITSSCEICSGPHDTQYCMENPKQAFVEYASSRTAKAGVLDKYVESLELGINGLTFVQGEISTKMEDPGLFTLPYGTKSYPVGIVKDVEVRIGKLKLLNDLYVIDMKKDPETPLLVGRGFLETSNAVIDYIKAKTAVGEGITRSIFKVKGVDLGEEEALYWSTLGKRESYKPRPSLDGKGA
ncbi:MAK10-like protein [Tanacetum coccineum]